MGEELMNKYRAVAVEIDGIRFDSQREGRRYEELKLLEMSGHIENLITHPKFMLFPATMVRGKRIREIGYTADVQYDEDGVMVVEDVKGFVTRDFKLRANLFQRQYPLVDFRIVK